MLMLTCLAVAAVAALLGRDDEPPTLRPQHSEPRPAPYTFVEVDLQDMPRPRVVARIIIEPAADDETAAALADAVRTVLRDHRQALVARVFGYGPGDNTNDIATRGIAEGSRDGKGWTGDGHHGTSPFDSVRDDGRIIVVVGNPMSGYEREFRFNR